MGTPGVFWSLKEKNWGKPDPQDFLKKNGGQVGRVFCKMGGRVRTVCFKLCARCCLGCCCCCCCSSSSSSSFFFFFCLSLVFRLCFSLLVVLFAVVPLVCVFCFCFRFHWQIGPAFVFFFFFFFFFFLLFVVVLLLLLVCFSSFLQTFPRSSGCIFFVIPSPYY